MVEEEEWEYAVEELEGERPGTQRNSGDRAESRYLGAMLGGVAGSITLGEAWEYGTQTGKSIAPELEPVGGTVACVVQVVSTAGLGYSLGAGIDYARNSISELLEEE